MTSSNGLPFYNKCVNWTRSIVLILSIFIVVLSLCIYNYTAIPLFSLHQQDIKQIMYDMINDRKLIATLVAAQTSIFCPLFLLMSKSTTSTLCTSLHHLYCQSTQAEITRTVIEQFCQFLMPLGLALSWIFCISFEKRTEEFGFLESDMMEEVEQEEGFIYMVMMKVNQQRQEGGWEELAGYIVNGLKYVIIGVLMLEVMIIWVSSIRYATLLVSKHQQQAIRLVEEEEEEEDYLVDCGEQVFGEEEKVLYI
jgi:hypothetical protein